MPDPPMMPRTDLVIAPLCPSVSRRGSPGHAGMTILNERAPSRGPLSIICAARSERRRPRILAARDLARFLDLVPHLLLGEVEQAREDDQEDQHLEADALARLQVRLGRPPHEGRARPGVFLERRREVIGGPGRPFEHFTLIVWPVLDLVLARNRVDLRRRESGASGLAEIAEREQPQAVAVLADHAIDLEAALELGAIEGPERPRERPLERRRFRGLL